MNLIEYTIAALTKQRDVNPDVIDRAVGKLREVLVLLETANPLPAVARDVPAQKPAPNKDAEIVVPAFRAKDYRHARTPASGAAAEPGTLAIQMARRPIGKP
jgi:hypothetical protein